MRMVLNYYISKDKIDFRTSSKFEIETVRRPNFKAKTKLQRPIMSLTCYLKTILEQYNQMTMKIVYLIIFMSFLLMIKVI